MDEPKPVAPTESNANPLAARQPEQPVPRPAQPGQIQSRGPVMDVKPRQPVPASDPEPLAAPPAETPDEEAGNASAEATKDVPAKPAAIKKAKLPRAPGVALAIVATVVIVLGLGLLVTYAYLRSQNIALL